MSALPAAFWARVAKTDDCWLWTGAHDRDGYGAYTESRTKKWRAHRLAYVATRGNHAPGLELDHRCEVRNCVRPDHLEPVTHAENMRRAALRRQRLQTAVCPDIPSAGQAA